MRRISEHREADAEKEIRKLYKSLLNDLKSDLGKLYANNADDAGVIDFARLRTNGRYAKFLELVEERLDEVSPVVRKEIRSVVQGTYKQMYDGMVDAVEKAANSEELAKSLDSIRAVTPETVRAAVQNPVSGLTLNETLEKNRQAVIYDIKQTITTGLVVGDHVSTMSKKLTEKVDMDYRKATRIVRTETHRVREAGANDAANEINDILEKSPHVDVFLVKIWRTKQDKAVRPQTRRKTKKGWKYGYSRNGADHVKMEGQIVKVNEKFDLGGGVIADCPGSSGVAAHDINCRCRAVRELMNAAEFEKATGRKLENSEKGFTNKNNSGIIKIKNSDLPNGLPLKGEPNSTVDKTDDVGKVLQRRVYGDDGLARIDFDTTDHNQSFAHPTGAHKHEFDYSKKNPHSMPLPLTDKELKDNTDIIKRGDNYHDKT